jgi:hypothetical protein
MPHATLHPGNPLPPPSQPKREELRHRTLTRNRILDWRRRRRAREAMPDQLAEIEREARQLLKR